MLKIRNLRVFVDEKNVVKDVDLSIAKGEVHALMGQNGSGKSSLAFAVAGHPTYVIESGEIVFRGKDFLVLEPNERVRAGVFLAFQSPVAIPGVSVFHFLRQSYEAVTGKHENVLDFKKRVVVLLKKLGLSEDFLKRYVNDGFSGGERKKMEILQVLLLKPKLVILDEVDSGLDVDSLKMVADNIRELVKKDGVSFLIISHYKRLFEYVKPDHVHVMKGGKIVKDGGADLIDEIEKEGYGSRKK